MSSWAIRQVHNWVALTVGVVFLAWLISGIVMSVPTEWWKKLVADGSAQAKIPSVKAAAKVDFRDIRISVPKAIAALEVHLGREAHVTGLKVTRFKKSLTYEITLNDGTHHLVDTLTGMPITVTQAVAQKKARSAAPHAGNIVSTTLLSKRDFYYWGPLPVYKIAFDDGWKTVVYVSAATGQTQRWNRLRRLHHWVVSLHTFEPLRLISESDGIRAGLLVLFAMVGIVAVATGFYIALPVRSRAKQSARRAMVGHGDGKKRDSHGSI